MSNLKKSLLALSMCMVVGQSFANTTSTTDTGSSSDISTAKTVEQEPNTKALLNELITSDEYSTTHHDVSWERKHEPKAYFDDGKDVDLAWLEKLIRGVFGASEAVGVLGKTIAILFLVLLAWWLYRTREIWMSWANKLSLPNQQAPKLSHIPHITHDVWADLPQAEELVAYVYALLKKGEYLLALSVLYRGTLRELNAHHALAIDKHQTEDECVWLLSQSNASPQESTYFRQLVALWRACAYGQKFASRLADGDGQEVHQLTQSWHILYGRGGDDD